MWPNPFAQSTVVDTKIFYARRDAGTSSNNGTTSLSSWQTWTKPNGCSFVYMVMISSGGGGGRTADGVTTVGAGGGGGGGTTRLFIPSFFLPETLYVWPGAGGLGATSASGTGGQGQPSVVACEPYTRVSNVAASSTVGSYVLYQVGATGGTPTNPQGAGALIGLITDQSIASSGFWVSVAGPTGGTGASTTNGGGPGVTPYNQLTMTTGGCGGGNGTGSGGTFVLTASPLKQNVAGGTGGASPAAGQSGTFCNSKIEHLIARGFPLIFLGGTGGGGSSSAGAAAGKGGDGAYGCGGGGGGGNSAAGSGGNGGNGGDGLIIIMAW